MTLQALAQLRLADAQALLAAGRLDAAYYLAGYVIECALKACIARAIDQYDFPDKKLAEKSWTHVLEDLIGVAGLRPDFDAARAADPDLASNWATVAQWSELFRYYEGVTPQETHDILQAITDPVHGVLPWLQQRW